MLVTKIKDDFLMAYKNKDFDTKNTLGLVKSEILLLEKEKDIVTDSEVIGILKKLLKGINESLSINKNENLLKEKNLLESYLPKQLSEDEIKQELLQFKDETNLGKVMGYFKKNFDGQVDMGLVSKLFKENK